MNGHGAVTSTERLCDLSVRRFVARSELGAYVSGRGTVLEVLRSAACAEFPNDNPALHRGAIWGCESTRGPATCTGPAKAAVEIVTLLEPILSQSESAPTPVSEVGHTGATERVEPEQDPFATLMRLLEDAARTSGASDDLAGGLRWLLGEAPFDVGSLHAVAVEALIAGNYVERTTHGIQRTEGFARTVTAWQGILRGDGEDFAACGAASLDEWAADMVARLLGSPTRAVGLRRELRRRGVAAFGLIAEAA
jgi:hypothetical protein